MSTDHGPTPPSGEASPAGPGCPPHYEIRVDGRLDQRWTAWFDGLQVTPQDDGTTVIRGSLVDQSALHGVLQKLRDIAIPLLSLTQLPDDWSDRVISTSPASPHNPSGATS